MTTARTTQALHTTTYLRLHHQQPPQLAPHLGHRLAVRRTLRCCSSSGNTHTRKATVNSNSSSSSSNKSDTRSKQAPPLSQDLELVGRTIRWLDRVVVEGLKLCPFAAAAKPTTRVIVSRAETQQQLLRELEREVVALRRASKERFATTLVSRSRETVLLLLTVGWP